MIPIIIINFVPIRQNNSGTDLGTGYGGNFHTRLVNRDPNVYAISFKE